VHCREVARAVRAVEVRVPSSILRRHQGCETPKVLAKTLPFVLC